MKHKRPLILITPIIIWLFSQAFLLQPAIFFITLALGALMIIFSVKLIAGRENRNWLSFIIAPLLFFISFSLYATIIINRFWIQLVFLLVVWFLFSYFRSLYHYFNHGAAEAEDKRINQIGDLYTSGGFLTIFAASAVLFDLPAFLNWPLILMLTIFVVLVGLLFSQFLPLRKLSWSATGFILIIDTLVLAEFAWVFSLLPLDFNVLALLLAIVYHLILTATRLYWRDELNRRIMKLPLILSAVAVGLLLLTARWL